ncbi:MAG TPA: hypothetical protein VG755_16540 [Nannocystaceae bacterium]|nr:hypothetical protein [Nannocystaceae bacterium]
MLSFVACREDDDADALESEDLEATTAEIEAADEIVDAQPKQPAQRRTLAELEAHRARLEAAAVRADVRFGRAGRSAQEKLRPSRRLLGDAQSTLEPEAAPTHDPATTPAAP